MENGSTFTSTLLELSFLSEKYSERVIEMLNSSVSRVPRKTQLSIVGALKHFWARHFLLQELPSSLGAPIFDPLLHHTCRIFNYCLGNSRSLYKHKAAPNTGYIL